MSQASHLQTGALRPRTRQCPECKKEILMATRTCNFCGKKVDSQAERIAKASKPAKRKKKPKRREYRWTINKQLIGAVMVLALVAFIIYLWYMPL